MQELDTEKDSCLSPVQEAELNEIIELDKEGLLIYSSWEDVKERITSKKGNELYGKVAGKN